MPNELADGDAALRTQIPASRRHPHMGAGEVRATDEAGIRAKLIQLGWTPPEWQPIETAPKDGPPILAFLPIEQQQAVVMWDTFGTQAAVSVEVGYAGHWRAVIDHTDEIWICNPTHWKPLGPNPQDVPRGGA